MKRESKTIKEWFQHFDEPTKTLDLNNLEAKPLYPRTYKTKLFDSLSSALFASFAWNKTQEDPDFWHDIYKEIISNPEKFSKSINNYPENVNKFLSFEN